jgi:sterol desaturase/sphingolipid hydroxylase (fatty acid hydroxylase superfamily)
VGFSILVGSHPLVFYVWVAMRLLQTYEVHSGVLLPWSQGEATAWHDYHHSHNRGCFGAMYLDYLCGTCDHYLVWKQAQQQRDDKR